MHVFVRVLTSSSFVFTCNYVTSAFAARPRLLSHNNGSKAVNASGNAADTLFADLYSYYLQLAFLRNTYNNLAVQYRRYDGLVSLPSIIATSTVSALSVALPIDEIERPVKVLSLATTFAQSIGYVFDIKGSLATYEEASTEVGKEMFILQEIEQAKHTDHFEVRNEWVAKRLARARNVLVNAPEVSSEDAINGGRTTFLMLDHLQVYLNQMQVHYENSKPTQEQYANSTMVSTLPKANNQSALLQQSSRRCVPGFGKGELVSDMMYRASHTFHNGAERALRLHRYLTLSSLACTSAVSFLTSFKDFWNARILVIVLSGLATLTLSVDRQMRNYEDGAALQETAHLMYRVASKAVQMETRALRGECISPDEVEALQDSVLQAANGFTATSRLDWDTQRDLYLKIKAGDEKAKAKFTEMLEAAGMGRHGAAIQFR